jgi:TATA-box binding protein (TBP) (component of TFIID and TFIIIB)
MNDINNVCPSFKVTVITFVIDTCKEISCGPCSIDLETGSVSGCPAVVGAKRFNNCTQIKFSYLESKNMNAKIFKNGKIHVTGLRNLNHIQYITGAIVEALCPFGAQEGSLVPKVSIKMINGNFKMPTKMPLHDLKIKDSSAIVSRVYQPCKYHGLILKHILGPTFIVYNTGSVCVVSNDISKINESMPSLLSFLSP